MFICHLLFWFTLISTTAFAAPKQDRDLNRKRARNADGAVVTPATIVDLWEGRAELKLQRELSVEPNNPSAAAAGWIAVDNGNWYWFYRDTPAAPRPAQCPRDYIRAVVRRSQDQGKTWSEKRVVAEPDLKTDGSGCAILDGATFKDPKTGTWHLLTQCLSPTEANRGPQWNLCHYTRASNGEGPYGSFESDSRNPVVRGGEIFRNLCKIPNNLCPEGIRDEGTPNFVGTVGEEYVFTFHGAKYEKNRVLGYRAMARTKDFKTWTTHAADGSLPNGVMYGPDDFQKAVPGSIGAGASTEIFAVDGNVYSLVETPDKTLMCTRGQYWPFLLVRASQKRMGSGNWEHPTKAPIPLLKPETREDPCSLQYARWVNDPEHGLFLIYWDSKQGHRLMKVERGRRNY